MPNLAHRPFMMRRIWHWLNFTVASFGRLIKDYSIKSKIDFRMSDFWEPMRHAMHWRFQSIAIP